MTLLAKINETAAFLKEKGVEAPEFGLILGSGLGELAEEMENWCTVNLQDVKSWPFKDVSTSMKEIRLKLLLSQCVL